MNRTRRTALRGTDAATLLTGAAAGEPQAFDGLFRRYGPEAWRFSSGVAGDDTTARYALTDGFATTVVAARDGIITHPGAFRRSMLYAARLRVAERDDPAVPGHAESTEEIAPAFAALPELLRSVLWLEHVHRLRPNRIAEVAGVAPADVADLARRAHHGVAAHHLDGQARVADESCAHALRGAARTLARRLPVRERVAVRAHLGSCASCRSAVAMANDLDTTLPPLATALPENLLDETRTAWIAAITPPSETGLSPRVEKVLAAASATAAVVAIVGAAYSRGDSVPQTVAVSPVLHQVGGPVPNIDRIDLDPPVEVPEVSDDDSTRSSDANDTPGSSGTPAATAGDAAPSGAEGLSGSDPTVSPNVGESDAGPSGDGTTGDRTTDDGGKDTPDEPEVTEPDSLLTVSVPLGDSNLDADVNDDSGLTVESTESTEDDSATVESGGTLDVLDPVTDAINGTLGG